MKTTKFLERADAIIALAHAHLAKKVKIPIRNPGILEVPKGKKLTDLDVGHFKNLVTKRGWNAISKALMNQVIWNKNDDPALSKWAKRMQRKLARWVDKERKTDE